MGIPEGVCLKCKTPLLIVPPERSEKIVFCSECEKKMNEAISKRMLNNGHDMKNKRLIIDNKS